MLFSDQPTDKLLKLLPDALNRRDRQAVNALVQALVARDAPLGRQWRTLAIVMTQNGEHNAAIDAVQRYALSQGNIAAARLEMVFTLHGAGRIAEARDLLASLPETVPDRASHAYLLGSLDTMLGNPELARAELETAVALAPDGGQSWLALATLDPLPDGAPIGDAVIAHDPDKTGGVMRNADAYYYALGKVHADRKEYRAAFEAFLRGARLARAARPYDPAAERLLIERVQDGFDRAFIERVNATVTIPTDRPIIVTGNPRSGTTLVEQILTSHSAVADGGELDLLRVIAQDIGGPLQADLERYLVHGTADELAALYLHLLDERFGPQGRIVDKRLMASRSLGVIAAILPETPLIWMRRDPLDCAWSCFRTYFNQSSPWSHDLEHIAQHFRLEDELLALWRERLGPRLLVVQYEDLVASPEEWTRVLLAHCGLSEEPAVFAPHKSDRAVTTASLMQVRRPINREGVGAAEPYRQFLQPFIDAYYV